MTNHENELLPEDILAAFTRIQNIYTSQAYNHDQALEGDESVIMPLDDMATLLMGFQNMQEAIMASWRLANSYAQALNIIDEGTLVRPEHQQRIHDFCKNLALALVEDYAVLRTNLTEKQASSVLPTAEIIPFPQRNTAFKAGFNA